MKIPAEISKKMRAARKIWLFLDYDGTLADFAPTPDHVLPDPEVISLIEKLAAHPKISPAIISGRRLAHIEKLVPLAGVWLAGSYGLEIRTPTGETLQRADFERLRPQLERLKPQWQKLIAPQDGFYLEDKGWSLALHARFAADASADQVLAQARASAEASCDAIWFQLLDGHKFLEIAPKNADKGDTVSFLLSQAGPQPVFPIYLGDDDKDEQAFPVVQAGGGVAGCVCVAGRTTQADFLLRDPQETRAWLAALLAIVE